MFTIELNKERIHDALNAAVGILNQGGIIAYPTETFYGLGVRFDMPDSLKRLYELKRRPAEKAMPVIIGDRESLSHIVSEKWLENIPDAAEALMETLWPGPLTLLLPAKEGISEFLTAGTGTIAVRIPGESFALRMAKRACFPITATSANLSGMPPAVEADEVIRYFGENIDLLIDGGRAPGGSPSTIADISGPGIRIVREGAIPIREIEDRLRAALKGN